MDENIQHLSQEQLQEIANGSISGTAGHEAARHLAACDYCEERLQEFELFLADCEQPDRIELNTDMDQEWQLLRRRLWWSRTRDALSRWFSIPPAPPKWATAAAALVILFGAVWLGVKLFTPSTSGLLAQAYEQQRPIEFRVAGARYAPLRIERGAGSAFSMPEPLLKAVARIAAGIKSSPDNPELLRLQGDAEMIQRQAAAAVRTLQKALDFSPQDPRILADLGSAYALRGDLERQPADYPNALEYMSRSLHLQPQQPELVFNRALVLERIQLKDQAVLEWERYLKLDGKSEWAKEARKHLADLKAAMKSREDALRRTVDNPDKFLTLAASKSVDAEAYLREIVVTKWLPRAGSDDRVREASTRLAQMLKEKHGDSWLSEMLAGLDSTAIRPGIEQLAAARAGNQTAHAGAAIEAARDAQKIFRRAGNKPGDLWARFEEVVALRVQLRSDDCLPLATSLVPDLDAHPSYVWLRAQARLEFTSCAMRVGRLSDATPALREALNISRAAGFGEGTLFAGIGYLESVGHAGLPSEVFATAEELLRTFWGGAYSSVRLQQLTDMLRTNASNSDQKYAVLFFARSSTWAADAALNPRLQAIAHAYLAVAAQEVGEDQEARASLDISDKLYPKLPSGYHLRPQTFLANVELGRGDINGALKRLEKLRAELEPPPPALEVAQYYQVLGEAYRRKGIHPSAIDAFGKSIDLGERRITSLASERERAGVLKTIEKSYRGLVASKLATSQDPSEGLHVWQSFRALDAVGTPGRLRPGDAQVLSFAELNDGMVGWLSRKDRVFFHRLAVPKNVLAAAAVRFRRECSSPDTDTTALRDDAKQLYGWMVEPFASQFSNQYAELVFELDGVIAGLPVQALMSRDGRYLGEHFSVLVSSGYTTAQKPAMPNSGATVLVVANPAVIGDSATRFPTLPDSLKEAEIVRSNFAGTTILEGRNATVAKLVASLPNADIFHFAGHGYSDSENGALLLAPKDPKTSDYELLRSADLLRQDWSRCRLAVLSACAAAAGEIQGAHNPDSLVRALTRAGAPRVAASLWNVESTATTQLMSAFYSALARGATPTQALRTAQEQVRHRPEWSHPYYWAGFQLFGTT